MESGLHVRATSLLSEWRWLHQVLWRCPMRAPREELARPNASQTQCRVQVEFTEPQSQLLLSFPKIYLVERQTEKRERGPLSAGSTWSSEAASSSLRFAHRPALQPGSLQLNQHRQVLKLAFIFTK